MYGTVCPMLFANSVKFSVVVLTFCRVKLLNWICTPIVLKEEPSAFGFSPIEVAKSLSMLEITAPVASVIKVGCPLILAGIKMRLLL